MCGIVGIVGRQPVAEQLVDALKRLEYRGYDSAGVATVTGEGLDRRRAEGKLRHLEERLKREPLAGHTGIGHTRWATHGAAVERNAHPHAAAHVSVVHNGIIENFRALKQELTAEGAVFESDTDTEVIAHLVSHAMARGADPETAVAQALPRLEGAFALALIFRGHDGMMIAARQGSPLAIGFGDGEMYLGSDAIALAPFTDQVSYLEDGDWAVLRHGGVTVRDRTGHIVTRKQQKSAVVAAQVDKGNHKHFMLKEIHEQPEVIGHTLARYIDLAKGEVRMPADAERLAKLSRITLSACGTAFYAGLTSRYWFEQIARLPVDLDIASEFRYREAPMEPGGMTVLVSQSGETADTLAALRYARSQGQTIGGVVNVQESSIAREADVLFPTLAGPEIGVASTKAFTCQLTVLACLSIMLGKLRGVVSPAKEAELIAALVEIPRLMTELLQTEHQFEALAQDVAKARDVLYLGRGASFPIALEGALKLKEISYIHAEGYAAGELKHGPIALIDENVPVVVVAPQDHLFEKTVSNMQEVAARHGKIILVTDADPSHIGCETLATIRMPRVHSFAAPLLYAVPMQLLAYHTAVFMGTDVDQPRNLAKSVTVE